MVRLGILGCADIAYRRFMPAAKQVTELQVVAVSEEYDKSKLPLFSEEYGLETIDTFEALVDRNDIDAIYIPQPPALHYKWAKVALEAGKHVLIEKPSTTGYQLTKELVELAREKNLTLHENYMFQYHSQIEAIKDMVRNGVVGDVRMYKANFGFPMRSQNDFRYNKALGGGALLDAGGYTAKLATLFLGKSIKADTAQLNYLPDYEVDMYGSATFSNDSGIVCQVGFGMDCSYQCNLEIWGSKGRLYTNRIFTAPDGYEPTVLIENQEGNKEIKLDTDSHFKHSIEMFLEEIYNDDAKADMYEQILLQAELVDDIRKKGSKEGE